MKRCAFVLIVLGFLLLVSCSQSTGTAVEKHPEAAAASPSAGSPAGSASVLPSPEVRYMLIKTDGRQEVEQRNPGLVKEFLQLLKAQKYSTPRDQWTDEYFVKLIGQEDKPLLEMSFGANSVTLDRDFVFEGTAVAGGTYEVEEWITEYLKSYYDGHVLNPYSLRLPARLRMGAEVLGEELIDRDSRKINLYEVIPQLKAFTEKHVAGKSYEILDSRAVHSYGEMEAEVKAAKARSRCISFDSFTSGGYLEIDSENGFYSFAKAAGLTIAEEEGKPYIYKVLTEGMSFTVKMDEQFDRQFNALFDLNASVARQVTPDEIKSLSGDRKENFMEYISKNLGLNSLELRPDYQFEMKPLKTGSGQSYQLLDFTDSYTTRLLIFKQNGGNLEGYVGNIDIKGWGDNVGYKIRSTGNKTFIVAGKNLQGHGTGFLAYSQDWYSVEKDTVKKVLSIPSVYEKGESYGFGLELKDLQVKNTPQLKLTADYRLSKYYGIGLPIADEYGNVWIAADKRAEFMWDESEARFVSTCKFDDQGIEDFVSDSQQVKDKCSEILEKYYALLDKGIAGIASEPENRRYWAARPYRAFLEDCNPGERVEKLKRKLPETSPDAGSR